MMMTDGRAALTIADASTGFMTRQAGDTLVGAWRVLTLFIGASVGIQTLIYV